jgi:transglutaminase-like putative cysteine protease
MNPLVALSLLSSLYGPDIPSTSSLEALVKTTQQIMERYNQISRGDLTPNIKELVLSPVETPVLENPLCQPVDLDFCFHRGIEELNQEWEDDFNISLAEYSLLSAYSHGSPQNFAGYLTPHDPSISSLAALLTFNASNNEEAAHAIMNFVRKTDYVKDGELDGYSTDQVKDRPYFPLEVLCRGKDDCEGTSTLASSLLWAAGIENVLVGLPGHEMVAIKGDFSGNYIEIAQEKFYLTETTSGGSGIGEISGEYITAPLTIEYPLVDPLLLPFE